ncbi:MAG: hypothetical protein IPF82_08010 [Blastocatellia bacterium]|nr:hypothetical protein [Blastocatellia bacterium]
MTLALSPDGQRVALAGGLFWNGVILWDLSSGTRLPMAQKAGGVHSVEFSPDGTLLLTCGANGVAVLWDVETGNEVRHFEGHSGVVGSGAFSADGRMVVTGGEDRTVRLWDASSGSEIRRFEGSTDDVLAVDISDEGISVVAGCKDGTARIWDVCQGALSLELTPTKQDICVAEFSRDGRFILSMSFAATVVFDVMTGAVIRTFDDLRGPGAISADWRVLVGRSWTRPPIPEKSPQGSEAGSLARSAHPFSTKIVEFESGRVLKRLEGYGDPVTDVSWAPNGRSLLTVQPSPGAVVWDIETGSMRSFPVGLDCVTTAAAFSPDGQRIAVVGSKVDDFSLMIRLFDVETSAELSQLMNCPEKVTPGGSVAFSPDGRFVAVEAYRRTDSLNLDERIGGAVLWDIASGSVTVFMGHIGALPISVAISLDASRVLTCDSRGVACHWDAHSGHELRRVHVGAARASYSPDGRFILTAGRLGPRLHDVASGAEVTRFQPDVTCSGPCRGVSAAYSPDGRSVVVRGDRVRVWDAQTGRLVRSSDSSDWAEVPTADERFGAAPEGCVTVLRNRLTGSEICRVVAFRDGSWAVTDPDGRFDTNTLDRVRGLHWIAPDDPFKPLPIEIFMRDFYEPRLLARLFSGEAIMPVPDLVTLDRAQPTVRIADIAPTRGSPEAVDVRVEVAAANRLARSGAIGGHAATGVFDLRLFRDGRLVGYSPESDGPVPLDVDGNGSVVFKGVRLPCREVPATVEFSAYAFNGDRVKSATVRRLHQVGPSTSRPHRRAYVVSIGVNVCDDPGLTLRFAVNDAVKLSRVITDLLSGTEEYEKVVAIPLVADDPVESAATKADIRTVLMLLAGKQVSSAAAERIPNASQIRPSLPDDLVVITFSGHGYADGSGNFYLVPSDTGPHARSRIAALGGGRLEELPDATRRSIGDTLSRCISSDELSLWLRDVDAGNMTMIIDACQSAAPTGKGFKPGPIGSRRLGQLAFDKRMTTLAATQADTVALEVAKLEHGLMTYILLNEGIEAGLADFSPRDSTIFLGELLRYAVERVPALHLEIASGRISTTGKTRPRIMVRGLVRDRDRGLGLAPSGRSLQKPALFDFSAGASDTLLMRRRVRPEP